MAASLSTPLAPALVAGGALAGAGCSMMMGGCVVVVVAGCWMMMGVCGWGACSMMTGCWAGVGADVARTLALTSVTLSCCLFRMKKKRSVTSATDPITIT